MDPILTPVPGPNRRKTMNETKRLKTAERLAWERYCHALALNDAACRQGDERWMVKSATMSKTWGERHSRLRLLVAS